MPDSKPTYADIRSMDEGEYRVFQTMQIDGYHSEVMSLAATVASHGSKLEAIEKRCRGRGWVCKGIVASATAAGAWVLALFKGWVGVGGDKAGA